MPERLERFRFAQLYIEGKKKLGRGDDTVGIRVPFMVQDLGLKILDVRQNDRAWHAFPPYRKESERLGLAVMRDFAEPTGEAMRAWLSENLRAGGASDEDVRRYFELTDYGEAKVKMREAIDAGTYCYLNSFTFYLTCAMTGAVRDYSSRLGQTDRFHAPLLRDMAAWLVPAPGKRILDAGCGAGGMSARLAAAVGPSGWVAALDLAPSHLEATRRLIETFPDAARTTHHERCMSTALRAFGHSFVLGSDPIVASSRRGCRSTSAFSSSFITSGDEAERCCRPQSRS